jgi:GINS complex subunit 2
MWRNINSISELEFLAETSLIEINPNFRKEVYKLTSGSYGPFKPNKAVNVPIWLAIQFKKKNRCKIIPPIWMDVELLIDKLEFEKKSNSLGDLPFYFYEICQILFHK